MIYTRNYNSCVYINGESLRNCLDSRGVSLLAASCKLGKSGNYLCIACKRGAIHPSIIELLKSHYGIEPEEYVKKEEESEHESDIVENVEVKEVTEKVAHAQTVTIDYNMLYQTIYTAVYHAIAKWELNEDQRKDVKEAV